MHNIREIYNHMGDELSRELYQLRLLYSLTGDPKALKRIVNHTIVGSLLKEFADRSQSGNLVIFGAGFQGKNILEYFPEYPWSCMIDNYVQNNPDIPLQIYGVADYVKEHDNSYYVVSSTDYCDDMIRELMELGVSADHICNYGRAIPQMHEAQYFDLPQLQLSQEEVFIDGGCYEGETVHRFQKWVNGKYKHIYSFEPDAGCFERCSENLAREDRFTLYPYGLWDKREDLHFAATDKASSRITNDGKMLIQGMDLDSLFGTEEVTYMKMDIEGAELKALHGAEQLIKSQKPKLAICVYHKPEDIWEIPEFLLTCNPGYRFYIRHYYCNHEETVLYAINEG